MRSTSFIRNIAICLIFAGAFCIVACPKAVCQAVAPSFPLPASVPVTGTMDHYQNVWPDLQGTPAIQGSGASHAPYFGSGTPAISETVVQDSTRVVGSGALQETEASVDLPKIQKLGKLVSLEGKPRGRYVVRELEEGDLGPEIQSGAEIEYDPENPSVPFRIPRLSYCYQEPYTNYRTDESGFMYMPGDGDQFGWISFESLPYLNRGYRSGLTTSMNMHLLSGPTSVALRPRLYDFSLGYQRRGRIADVMSYDIATTFGVFSDFEDSARDGIRFPGHAVGMLHYTPELDLVFGVDYVSRDDYKILPVMGFSLRPKTFENLRLDIIFPRPRIDYLLDGNRKMYFAGRLGGGTWDIEFPNDANDVMTYRDLQLLVGFERRDSDGETDAIEFGYVYDRRLSFRTQLGETHFDDAFVLRFVSRK